MPQQAGCEALAILAVNNENKTAIARAGGFDAAVSSMGRAQTRDVLAQRRECEPGRTTTLQKCEAVPRRVRF